MDERTEQGRRFLMGYCDDDTTEFVSDQEKKLPQPPLCKAPMGGERTSHSPGKYAPTARQPTASS